MKKLSLILFLFTIFTTGIFAQISTQNYFGEDTRNILLVYDIDSAATLTSKQFSLNDFDGAISIDHPITFYFDNATDGAPATALNIEIILWGVYNSASYTYPLDTIIAHAGAQGVDDSLGVLTLNGNSAPTYYITITNTGGNGSGVLSLTIPLRENARVSDLDHSH